MSTDVTSIRIQSRDALVIEHFIQEGMFESKSDFIRYAIRKTVNELVLRDIRESLGLEKTMKNVSREELQREIRDIRKKLWEDYSENLSG